MKNYDKIFAAILITLILALVKITAWASPLDQGTVPVPTKEVPVSEEEPVTVGTFQFKFPCGCYYKGQVSRITEPEKDISPAPEKFEYLTDAFKVQLEGACDIEVCYPYPKEYENQKGQIYKWDSVNEEWNWVDSRIYENPKQICVTDRVSNVGIYALISSDEIKSVESPSRIRLCGCSIDDVITTLEDPEENLGPAPSGLEFLTSATRVDNKVPCDVEVCYPYTEDVIARNADIYKWDPKKEIWSITTHEIFSDPDYICTANEGLSGGIFALIGK